MKKLYFLLPVSLCFAVQGFGQMLFSVGFEKDTLRLEKSAQSDVIIPINLESKLPDTVDYFKNYILSIQVNEGK